MNFNKKIRKLTMKIKLKITSGNYNKYKDFLLKYQYEEDVTYSNWYEPDIFHKERYRITYIKASIHINSLDELFELAKFLPNQYHEIIINNDIEDEDSPYIEIYDGCRE